MSVREKIFKIIGIENGKLETILNYEIDRF